LARSFDEELPPEIFDDYDPFKLSEVLAGKEIVEIKSGKTGDVIRASYPIMTPNAAKEISGVAVVSYHLPLGTVDRMRSITAAFEEYKQLKILKNPIKVSYMITFLTITLLVIFAAIWFGFYLARGISVPIQELAQGTKAVAEGRLDYKIEFQSDDELGMLIESFNKMTGDLFKGSLQLEQANTDLLTSNQEIDRRRIHMETVLANINTGVISIDAMGFISMINKSAQSMLSFSDKDVSKSHYDEVFGQYNLYSLKLLADRVNEGYLKKVDEQVQLNINGSILTFIVNINPLTDEAGEYLGKVLVFDDLTELTKVQRVAAWREVARRIAHEIKNPLTPIQLSTQRLRKKHREKALDYEKIFDECTKIIIQEVDELKNLVDEFSNFARLPEAKPKLNNLHKILEEVVTLYQASNKDTRLYAEFGSRISHIKVDREQIKRAIINLIDNSIEAMGGKGEILVVTSLNDDLDVVRIAIKDQGPGISAQDKKRLFVPYFSTKKEGTGLGLAIVNRIVSDHKGYIRVSDNFPVGTVMTIELPVDSRAGNYRATG
jgi:two-component system nitrogen regulation sensor histidine kinase NtrY